MTGAGHGDESSDSESTEYNDVDEGRVKKFVRQRTKTVVRVRRRWARYMYWISSKVYGGWQWCTMVMERTAALVIPAGVMPPLKPQRRRANSLVTPPVVQEEEDDPIPVRREQSAPIRPPTPETQEEEREEENSSSSSTSDSMAPTNNAAITRKEMISAALNATGAAGGVVEVPSIRVQPIEPEEIVRPVRARVVLGPEHGCGFGLTGEGLDEAERLWRW